MRKCKIGIVGFGTVGSGIYKILSSEVDSHPILKEIEIAKIAVNDLFKGSIMGIPPQTAASESI